ncbi:isoflavone reductase family protein [Heliocybe sulcata]|uniref:Isoflavone reductase family protein n=1 Tax=Heliocybe sulcata TaxID=5364 RepID=A0A5C3NJS7_9AGAM|nr:isoflavone reductase family protein [Heliocybe sulcata]
MSKQSSILILGAGELGNAVLAALAERYDSKDVQLSLGLRPQTAQDSAKTQHYRSLASPHELHIISVDIASATGKSLADTFRNGKYDVVLSCTGFTAGRGTQVKLAKAVLEAGVKRYFPWQFGVDYDVIGRGSALDLFDEQLDVRDILRGQDRTQWVIVSTGMFTSFLFEESFGLIEKREGGEVVVRGLGGWDNRVTVTAAEDIGRLTAEVVVDENVKGVVYTAGETISYTKFAELVESAVGSRRTVEREVWTVEELKEELRKDPENPLRKYRVVFAEGRGVSWDKGKTFNVHRGIQTIDVGGWIKAHEWTP